MGMGWYIDAVNAVTDSGRRSILFCLLLSSFLRCLQRYCIFISYEYEAESAQRACMHTEQRKEDLSRILVWRESERSSKQ